MEDIARMAGVSRSTVSRALSGTGRLSEETRNRIIELAKTSNYSVDASARNLRLNQNRTVSVVVPYDPVEHLPLSEPFFLTLVGSIADALTACGMDMLLSRVSADRLDLAAEPYKGGRCLGFILIGQWGHHDQLTKMAVQGLPFVVWGARMPDQLYGSVGGDNVQGGLLATAHLLDQGARRIAFLGDPAMPEIGQRHAGYLQAHHMRGLVPAADLTLPVGESRQAVDAAIAASMARDGGFDAVFASNDPMAMNAIGALVALGKKVPDDVLVVGYDDISTASQFQPPLSSVRTPMIEAGKALVASLLAQLSGTPPAQVQLPAQLMPRRSSTRGEGRQS
ncbi:LacI family DNA-binding transcriptional regulator [Duganella sp. LX47W]|uniref:LacI family DNA-binding transcriptional regulator n=2 Tax=Rugamonas apoptosis TaxID=2758570 RepID=A0A7W2ILI7_9BURK|nr:LacI family DNA-binding transcriptional regulator [Rugamonas apoptosis]